MLRYRRLAARSPAAKALTFFPGAENSTRAHVWTSLGLDPDQCPQPIIAPVRLRGTGDHPHLDQPISSTLRLPMGSLERVRGLP